MGKKLKAKHKKQLEAFLRKTLTSDNKFVRAWSYNGFHCLASQFPEYVREVEQFFKMAMNVGCIG